jgi:hypothetical protein
MKKIKAEDIHRVLLENNIRVYKQDSDIQVYCSEKARKIIDQFEFRQNVTVFDAYGGGKMYEIPFCWDDEADRQNTMEQAVYADM